MLLLRSAIEDLIRGRKFYEDQGEGLGDYFEESVGADIDSLRLYAGVHMMQCGYHRMLCARFPYAVYYDLAGDEIRVRAVLDCRRDPRWIRSRLRSGKTLVISHTDRGSHTRIISVREATPPERRDYEEG